MIHFNYIKFKNILSYGNNLTEVDLVKAPINIIMGNNGEGKSTLVDVITFALYGTAFRKINKGNIVNNINKKEAYVSLSFTIKDDEFMIERGIKPDLFNIYKNGELLPQHGSMSQQQEFLEDEIIRMNKTMYTHQVMISKTSNTPFLELSTPKRREFNEYMLNLHIFEEMDKRNKENINSLKEELNEISHEKVKLEQSQSQYDNQITYIQKVIKDKEEEINLKNKQIESINKSSKDLSNQIEELETELNSITINKEINTNDLEKELTDLQNQLAVIEHKGFEVAKELKFLEENDTCSSCNQVIFNKENKIKEADIEKQDLAKNYLELRRKIVSIQREINEIKNTNEENRKNAERSKYLRQQIKGLNSTLQGNERLLESINTSSNTNTIENDKKSLDEALEALGEIKSKLVNINSEEKKLLDLEHQYNIASQSLKDDGIKASVINEYIPFINEMMNKYLTQFGVEFIFNLDERFNDTITTYKGNKLTYNNLSEGQKQRVNLSMLMTWREVAKKRGMLYSNLLFLDEVFDSSLDQSGVDTFIEILETLEEMNIFIISHTPEKINADRKLRIYRDDAFSYIEEI